MTLQDLTEEEQLALVALMEATVVSDATVSDTELARLDELVNTLGEERFQALADEAEQRFEDREALKAFLRRITRQEARELIYGTVLSEALVDTVPHSEAQFLDWLAAEWQIAVRIEPNPDQTGG